MNGITVSDICELFIDDSQRVDIWSDKEEKVVWSGTAYDVQDTEYGYMEVSSIDNIEIGTDVITLNVFDEDE